ncbi:MAG: hydroxymethylbilane synthase [Chloroflexota bacterium]|nr:hydroxymethylbilane synthase [Chloroflexota bacterium]
MTNDKNVKRKTKIVVGTRGSALAQWQTNYIIAALKRIAPDLEIETRIIKTTGDQDQMRSLADLGGLGVFTKEIENALLAREIDLAVHSLKDLPTETATGLAIAAIPEREDPRDCIVSRHGAGLAQLPRGARVGTSSARRTAQVLALRPDAQIIPLRGNVDTRLRKSQTEEYDAVVLAAAGIIRLGRANEITEYLPLETFLPDPGQGALAVEIRADDAELAARVAPLDHAPTRAAVTAECAFLRALGGGCRMPIGAYAEMRDAELHLCGIVASDDGKQISRGEISDDATHAEELGAELATRLASPDPKGFQKPFGSQSLSLRGKRILITRAREQAGALAEKIRALGGEPIEFPTIDFAPLEDFRELDGALHRVAEFDWVVFTSANGVRFVVERLRALGLGAPILATKIAAIGPATARALEQFGWRADFMPTKYLGEQIAVELPIQRGQRALLLRADIASDVLARGLQARGVSVTDVDAYRTVMPTLRDLRLKEIDAITFTSSSTVKNFLAMRDGDCAELARAKVFCIGPVTADTARELGLGVDAVAAEHTIDGLVSAMANYYGTRINADKRG